MSAAIATCEDLKERLQTEIVAGLAERGIDAEVSIQPVPDVNMYRVFASSPRFRNLWASERQDMIWKVLEERFNRSDVLRISAVVPLTPDEIEGVWPENGSENASNGAR